MTTEIITPETLDTTCTDTSYHVHVIGYTDGDQTTPDTHQIVTDGTHMHLRDQLTRNGMGWVSVIRHNTGSAHRQTA